MNTFMTKYMQTDICDSHELCFEVRKKSEKIHILVRAMNKQFKYEGKWTNGSKILKELDIWLN